MFSLIISIISIALVAALAAATVYFGGAAFNKGSAGAEASAFINAGQQIAGAFTLALTDGDTDAATVGALANDTGEVYLTQVPTYKGTALSLSVVPGLEDYVSVTSIVSNNVCEEIVDRAGVAAPADEAALVALTSKPLFTCIEGGTPAANVAYYKVK